MLAYTTLLSPLPLLQASTLGLWAATSTTRTLKAKCSPRPWARIPRALLAWLGLDKPAHTAARATSYLQKQVYLWGGRKQPGPPQPLLPSQLLSPGGAWGWLLTPPQLATSVIYAALTLGGHRLSTHLRDGPLPRALPRPHTASSANTAWDSAVNKGFGSLGPAVCLWGDPRPCAPCGARLPFLMGTCVKGASLGEAAALDWALMQELWRGPGRALLTTRVRVRWEPGDRRARALSPCAPATQAEACCEAALRPPEAAAVPSPGCRLGPAPPDGWVGSGLGCPCTPVRGYGACWM